MSIEKEIIQELKSKGVEFIHFVDVSHVSPNSSQQLPHAILFGIYLTPAYLKKVSDADSYVADMIINKEVDQDEFHNKEIYTDRLADKLAEFIISKGYNAFSQSEGNLLKAGKYNEAQKRTPLPHKTIALMAQMGWIGKNNLLVTPDYGCAISMCSVLTDAPLNTICHIPSTSKCGNCTICKNICSDDALSGQTWGICTNRDKLIDVFKCTTCLKCMAHCKYTQAYIKKSLNVKSSI